MTASRTVPAGRDDGSDRISLPRLLLRYVATGTVVLVVVAVVTAYASRAMGTREAVEDAVRATALVTEVVVGPAITPELVAGEPAALAAFDAVVRRYVVRGSMVRVKLWAPDGRVVYSDEARLIGERFALEADDRDVLGTGVPRAGLSDLSDPENRYEERAVQLLEVYQRVRAPDGTPLLFEAYFRYAGVAEAGRGVWLRFAPYLLGALVLLAALQLPIAVALARRLRRYQREREHLLRRALEATDTERRRIASDLHDGVVQDLAGVAFALGADARSGRSDPTALAGAADGVRSAVRSLRSLLVEIYPPNLYEEGLEAALSDLLARLGPRGVATSLDVDVAVDGLTRDEVELLYRVAQEGLRNVVAHAEAGTVCVRLHDTPRGPELRVADDGRGIAPGPLPDRPDRLGLRSLAGLAERLGATLHVESGSDAGTVLRLVLPPR